MRHIYQREVVDEAAATALVNAMGFFMDVLGWQDVTVRAEGKTVVVSSANPIADPEAMEFVEIGSVDGLDDVASTKPLALYDQVDEKRKLIGEELDNAVTAALDEADRLREVPVVAEEPTDDDSHGL